MSRTKFICSAIVCLLGMICLSPLSEADVLYTYTGNAFDQFTGYDNCPSVCAVTGTFEVSAPLPANLPLTTLITPIGFVFSDGNATLNPVNSDLELLFMATDSLGQIDQWVISVIEHEVFPLYIQTWIQPLNPTPILDRSFQYGTPCPFTCVGPVASAIVDNDPGSWAMASGVLPAADIVPVVPVVPVVPAVVPEPRAISLLPGVLIIIGCIVAGRREG